MIGSPPSLQLKPSHEIASPPAGLSSESVHPGGRTGIGRHRHLDVPRPNDGLPPGPPTIPEMPVDQMWMWRRPVDPGGRILRLGLTGLDLTTVWFKFLNLLTVPLTQGDARRMPLRRQRTAWGVNLPVRSCRRLWSHHMNAPVKQPRPALGWTAWKYHPLIELHSAPIHVPIPRRPLRQRYASPPTRPGEGVRTGKLHMSDFSPSFIEVYRLNQAGSRIASDFTVSLAKNQNNSIGRIK